MRSGETILKDCEQIISKNKGVSKNIVCITFEMASLPVTTVIMRLDRPRFRSYIPRKLYSEQPDIEPGTPGKVVRYINHYTTEAIYNNN